MSAKKRDRFEKVMTVSLDPEAMDAGKRAAATRLAKESKIKGFRPGKAPMKVVESVVGAEELRREAIDEALPTALGAALREAEIDPAIYPRVTDIRDEGESVEVDVLVTLWPEVDEVPEYAGLEVAVEIPEVTDADVEAQLEQMRDQFAELEDVTRQAFDDDFVVVDLTTTLDGAEYAAGSATDLLYEVGSGALLEGLDDQLRGSAAGAILAFDSRLPDGIGDAAGREVSVRALVKQVKAKRRPELTDEWVEEISEFESVEEMRRELAAEMASVRRHSAWRQVEERVLADLVESMDLEIPESLANAEMDGVFHRFAHRLEDQGVGFDQYLAVTGQDQEAFLADLRSQADINLKTRIFLEAVADQEGITVEQEELDGAVRALAGAARVDEDDYRKALSEGGRELALAGDILRRKAIDRILDLVVPVDGSGVAVELPPRRHEAPEEGDAVETAPDDEGGQGPAEVDE